MKRCLIISAIIHSAMILALWVGLPNFLPPLPVPTMIVPVEVADIDEITNLRVKKNDEPVEDKQPALQKKDDLKKSPDPKPEEEKAEPEPEPPPPPPPAESDPEKLKQEKLEQEKAEQEEKEKEEAEALEKKRVEEKKKKEAEKKKRAEEERKKLEEEKKRKKDLLASVLKNVAEIEPKETAKKRDDKKKRTKPSTGGASSSDTPALSDRITISEQDSLRRQISSCWNMPIGARNAEDLIVEVVISVNQDRTVSSVEVLNTVKLADPFYRAAAESAVRALRHPRCNPLSLPPDKYDQWKEIHFTFDPRDML